MEQVTLSFQGEGKGEPRRTHALRLFPWLSARAVENAQDGHRLSADLVIGGIRIAREREATDRRPLFDALGAFGMAGNVIRMHGVCVLRRSAHREDCARE